MFKGLGRLKNFKAKFSIKKHAQPFVKPCLPIPLHLKDAVLEKIKYFIECGVLEYLPPNTPARYVCSLIVVPKTGGKVRICANLKPLNEIIERSRFVPAPRLEEFQDKLRGCTIFGSVDIKEAYHQIAIDEETANLCVISTVDLGLKIALLGIFKTSTSCGGMLLQKWGTHSLVGSPTSKWGTHGLVGSPTSKVSDPYLV